MVQVKHLTVPQRVKLARLIVSLAEDNEAATLKNYIDMGYRSKHMNPDVIKKYAAVYFRDNKPETLDHKMIHEVRKLGGSLLFSKFVLFSHNMDI